MKKILFSAVDLNVGGIETALVTLLNYLANEYDITLVLEKKQGALLNKLDKRIEIIEYKPSNNKIVLIRKMINLMKQIHFKRKYKSKFDFSCSYATYSNPASLVARIASKNSALWVHSEYMQMFNNDEEKYIQFFKGIRIKKFKTIIFVSQNSKKIFEKTLKKYNEYKDILGRTVLIHNLIDYNQVIEKSKENIEDIKKENRFTFLHVGRHTEEDKKITRIIEVAKMLKEDKLQFRIILVGKGKETEKYKCQVEEYGLQDKIIFLGEKQNPYPYFRIADSLILTSEYEGFPVVFIEGMILELPIITTNVSDSMEIINNKYGIVVEKNIESIYNEMKYAIKHGIKCKEKFDYVKYNSEIKNKIKKLID